MRSPATDSGVARSARLVRLRLLRAAACAALAVAAWSPASGQERAGPAPLIPRALLFGDPDRLDAKLSPTGTHYAYLAPDRGVLNVWVAEVGARESRPVTSERRRGLEEFIWAGDGRRVLYLADDDGDENWALHSSARRTPRPSTPPPRRSWRSTSRDARRTRARPGEATPRGPVGEVGE